MRKIGKTICPQCRKPSPFGLTHPGCRTRYSLDGLVSPYRYTGPIQKAVKYLKFRRVQDIAPFLCAFLVDQLHSNTNQHYTSILRSIEVDKPVLVPVPLHPIRKRKRWFNQSELLAVEIGKRLKLPVASGLLLRVKNTKPQSELRKNDRMKNIKGAFQVSKTLNSQFSTLNCILVDDVWTTGATMREAGNVLKRTGVKKVWALTVAR